MDRLGYYAYLARTVAPSALLGAAVRRAGRAVAGRLRGAPPLRLLAGRDALPADRLPELVRALRRPWAGAPLAPRLFLDAGARGRVRRLYATRLRPERDALLARAAATCAHRFDFGEGPVPVDDGPAAAAGRRIDWHRDHLSGVIFPAGSAAGSPLALAALGDPRVPWALARGTHLVELGVAAWAAGDRSLAAAYAAELVTQVDDFCAANPPGLGVNWTCTMEVAQRAVSWLGAWHLLRDQPACDDAFAARLAVALWQHGRHIVAHLENTGVFSGSHLVADWMGLLHVAAALEPLPEAGRWRAAALRGLAREQLRQVHPDGVSFEGSVAYHRLSTELFTLAALCAERLGAPLPAACRARLRGMYRFVAAVLGPDGTVPEIGDSDGSRGLAYLPPRPHLAHGYLIELGERLFGPGALAGASASTADRRRRRPSEEALWLLGPEASEDGGGPGRGAPPAVGNRRAPASAPAVGHRRARASDPALTVSFPDAGFYVLAQGGTRAVISAGPNGQGGAGGHAHNDKLSLVAWVGGRLALYDPGSFVYLADPAWRDRFRATASHSTVTVDGEEQNPLCAGRPFALPDRTRARGLRHGASPPTFLGEHLGYDRLGVRHRRQVVLLSGKPLLPEETALLVEDELLGRGVHRLDVRFQLATRSARVGPGRRAALRALVRRLEQALARKGWRDARLEPERGVLIVEARAVLLPLAPPTGAAPFAVTLDDGWIAPRFGRRERRVVARYHTHGELPRRFAVVLAPLPEDVST